MSGEINVAVVGTGYWGPNLVRNLTDLDRARLKAVCDTNPERLTQLTEKYRCLEVTTRVDEILARRDVDAVFIATPAATHFELAKQSLEAGKHVYIEKPLTTDVTEARSLVEMADRCRRVLMVGHLYCYDPAMLRLVELVRGGSIGALLYVYGQRVSMSGTARLDTSIIWDALIHDAYILPELFGRDPERVLVVGGSYLRAGTEDVAFVTFDFGGGRLFQTMVSWYALAKVRTLAAVGRTGMIGYDGYSATPLVRYNQHYRQSDERDPAGRSYWKWFESDGEVIAVDPAEPLREECAHFIACIADGATPKTDGRAGLRAVELLHACSRSAGAGGVWQEVIHAETGSAS